MFAVALMSSAASRQMLAPSKCAISDSGRGGPVSSVCCTPQPDSQAAANAVIATPTQSFSSGIERPFSPPCAARRAAAG
jgi:hypothetical protein